MLEFQLVKNREYTDLCSGLAYISCMTVILEITWSDDSGVQAFLQRKNYRNEYSFP